MSGAMTKVTSGVGWLHLIVKMLACGLACFAGALFGPAWCVRETADAGVVAAAAVGAVCVGGASAASWTRVHLACVKVEVVVEVLCV